MIQCICALFILKKKDNCQIYLLSLASLLPSVALVKWISFKKNNGDSIGIFYANSLIISVVLVLLHEYFFTSAECGKEFCGIIRCRYREIAFQKRICEKLFSMNYSQITIIREMLARNSILMMYLFSF